MTCLGHMENGVIVLDAPEIFPEGTPVRVESVLQPMDTGAEVSGAPVRDGMIGLFYDEPELMDAVVEMAYKARSEQPWRAAE